MRSTINKWDIVGVLFSSYHNDARSDKHQIQLLSFNLGTGDPVVFNKYIYIYIYCVWHNYIIFYYVLLATSFGAFKSW